MGILYDNSLAAFVIITLLLAGGASWMSGRALAQTWQPVWLAAAYALLLALPARFLHWALADGSLLSAHYFLTDAILLILIGFLSYRIFQTSSMVNQYPWLYERTSLISWGTRKPDHKEAS